MILRRIAGMFDPVGWKQRFAEARGRWFDARHGIETVGRVPVEAMTDIGQDAAGHAVQYEPSSIPKFERAFDALDIDPRTYTFIDFGSGKGRVLMLAAQHPFRRIIGVEISPALHAAAEANVAAFRRRHSGGPPIECICADARGFVLPGGDLLAYFYNPFDATILAPVAERLIATCEHEGRSLAVVYINPIHSKVFDMHPALHRRERDSALAIYQMSRELPLPPES